MRNILQEERADLRLHAQILTPMFLCPRSLADFFIHGFWVLLMRTTNLYLSAALRRQCDKTHGWLLCTANKSHRNWRSHSNQSDWKRVRTEEDAHNERGHTHTHTHTHTHLKHTLNIQIKVQIVSTLGHQHCLLLLFTVTSITVSRQRILDLI